MKKAGLISVAAAVALASSAFAGEVKISADATVKGMSVTNMTKEANEYNNLEVNLGIVAKNDDGITMKAGWVVYDGLMGQATSAKQANLDAGSEVDRLLGEEAQAGDHAVVVPTLDYGYVIAPLTPELTLKSGFVEGGPFGTNMTNSGDSTMKPVAIDYKVVDGINVGLELMKPSVLFSESGADNKGGMSSTGDGEIDATRIYVKGKAGDIGYGARVTTTTYGKDAVKKIDLTAPTITETDGAASKELSKMQTEVYVAGKAASVDFVAHYAMVSMDDELAGSNDKSQSGLYAHALLSPVEGLTTGLAFLSLDGGFSTASEFDPTYITDEVLDALPSSKDDGTSLVVIPVIYGISDMLTAEANIATGTVIKDSYTEIDVGLNVALGKATNLKLMYATASGDSLKAGGSVYGATGEEDGISMMGWQLSTAF